VAAACQSVENVMAGACPAPSFLLFNGTPTYYRLAKVSQVMAEEFLHRQFPSYTPAPGEDYMSEKQAAHFREMLTALRQEMSNDIERTVHTLQDETTSFADPNDRASQESDLSLELRSRDRERKLIKKINEALQRIEDGEYGYCDSCGVEIGLKRLEARPTATLCIDCKTLEEIRERQVAR
jgi:DnaK suppressor protein